MRLGTPFGLTGWPGGFLGVVASWAGKALATSLDARFHSASIVVLCAHDYSNLGTTVPLRGMWA